MPTSLDDMGVAIFWKSSRFEAHELKVQSFPLGGKGLLQAGNTARGVNPRFRAKKGVLGNQGTP